MNNQVVLSFIPGYYWDGNMLKSTGVALEPTQHINPDNGEIRYYVKPLGWGFSAYIRRNGILDYLNQTGKLSM